MQLLMFTVETVVVNPACARESTKQYLDIYSFGKSPMEMDEMNTFFLDFNPNIHVIYIYPF